MAFFKYQKSPSKRPPKRSWRPEEMKIIGWCLNRNINISISPCWKEVHERWQIEIKIKNKVHKDPNKYTSEDVYNKVLEYYKYYYKPNTNNNG